jgi:HTH-type transcriptional regulator / antitoxin HigA
MECARRSEDEDRLELLAILVEKYEEERWPAVDGSDPVDLLHFVISNLGHCACRKSISDIVMM